MLEELEMVPWANLKQAHGNSFHVPAAIRDLASQDAREAAFWKLDNYVVLPGMLRQKLPGYAEYAASVRFRAFGEFDG